jgi:hypothetical protein
MSSMFLTVLVIDRENYADAEPELHPVNDCILTISLDSSQPFLLDFRLLLPLPKTARVVKTE